MFQLHIWFWGLLSISLISVTITSSLRFLYIFWGCGLLCAIAFFRALFGCFVLNFSSHFLLLTPPGKKTTTGDTTSSLKNYIRSKQKLLHTSVFKFAYFVSSEWKVQCCLRICVLVHSAKIKICTAKKVVKLQQLLFVLLDCLCLWHTLSISEQTKLYQNYKREKCYFVFWF